MEAVTAKRALRAVAVALIAIVVATGLYLLAHLALQGSHEREFQPLIEDTRKPGQGQDRPRREQPEVGNLRLQENGTAR